MEKRTPKVSVVIPVYNCEQYISQAIESVLSQTFQDLEILVVDDGSSDRSPKIIKQYAAQYPEKVKYLEHQNHQNCGVSVSRNLGIQYAKGEYIAFLDSDNVWLPDKLQIQVKVLDTYREVGLVYCPVVFIDDQGNPTKEMYGTYIWGMGTPDKVDRAFDLIFSRATALALGTTALIRKHILFEVGLFDIDLAYGEDEIVAGKVTYLYPVFFYSQPLAKFRIHPTNVTWNLMVHDRWKKVEYLTMLRIYQWLQKVSPESRSREFRVKLANLSLQAYQRGSISRWSLYKLLIRMFPYRGADRKTTKLFFAFLLSNLPNPLNKAE